MPAAGKIFAEQEFSFERVRVAAVLGVFKIERRAQRDFAPVGEGVAKFDGRFVLVDAPVLVDGPSFVKIELEATGAAGCHVKPRGGRIDASMEGRFGGQP